MRMHLHIRSCDAAVGPGGLSCAAHLAQRLGSNMASPAKRQKVAAEPAEPSEVLLTEEWLRDYAARAPKGRSTDTRSFRDDNISQLRYFFQSIEQGRVKARARPSPPLARDTLRHVR